MNFYKCNLDVSLIVYITEREIPATTGTTSADNQIAGPSSKTSDGIAVQVQMQIQQSTIDNA